MTRPRCCEITRELHWIWQMRAGCGAQGQNCKWAQQLVCASKKNHLEKPQAGISHEHYEAHLTFANHREATPLINLYNIICTSVERWTKKGARWCAKTEFLTHCQSECNAIQSLDPFFSMCAAYHIQGPLFLSVVISAHEKINAALCACVWQSMIAGR